MKHVGLYAMLMKNALSRKDEWGKFGLNDPDIRINLIFCVLLFLMESSLREEVCTMDEISIFLDGLNSSCYHMPWTFDDCHAIGSFLVNDVLMSNGIPMNFTAYDHEEKKYLELPVRYINNSIAYMKGDVKRTAYSLSDDGYNLILSTLEIENNLRLPVQVILFQMHLDRKNYDMALDDIKDIFNRIRIHIQRVRDTMTRIRRNVLLFSAAEYHSIMQDDLDMIRDTKEKFEGYQQQVEKRRAEIEDIHVNVRKLRSEEKKSLANLKEISAYLSRTLEEHQKILNYHFDLKDLYQKELENLSEVSGIRRFSLREKVYDPIMRNPDALIHFEAFLSPLILQSPKQQYNLGKAFIYHRITGRSEEEDETEEIDFDERAWREERLRQIREKNEKREGCLHTLLSAAINSGQVTLSELRKITGDSEEKYRTLIPDTGTFKEVLVELLRIRELNIPELKKERAQTFTELSAELSDTFEPNIMILDILDQIDPFGTVQKIRIVKNTENEKGVVFENVPDRDGKIKRIRCSDITITVVTEVADI